MIQRFAITCLLGSALTTAVSADVRQDEGKASRYASCSAEIRSFATWLRNMPEEDKAGLTEEDQAIFEDDTIPNMEKSANYLRMRAINESDETYAQEVMQTVEQQSLTDLQSNDDSRVEAAISRSTECFEFLNKEFLQINLRSIKELLRGAPHHSPAFNKRKPPKRKYLVFEVPLCPKGTVSDSGCKITLLHADGAKFVGQIKNGKFQGKGTITFPDGGSYQGHFVNNKYHGEGIATGNDGDRYEGNFRFGNFHGKGTFTTTDAEVFAGDFKIGKFSGQGTATLRDGSSYTGGFRRGTLYGQGTYTWPGGDQFQGKFILNRAHGIGTYTRHNGEVYKREFRRGKPIATNAAPSFIDNLEIRIRGTGKLTRRLEALRDSTWLSH